MKGSFNKVSITLTILIGLMVTACVEKRTNSPSTSTNLNTNNSNTTGGDGTNGSNTGTSGTNGTNGGEYGYNHPDCRTGSPPEFLTAAKILNTIS